MEFNNHKYKLVVSICLLNAEKDRIKEILKSYNNRLEYIYNNLISIMDQMEELNKIEKITDEKEQINNLIIYSKINNNNNETNLLKNNIECNINKIDEKNIILENKIINKNEYTIIKNVCNNTFSEDTTINNKQKNKLINEVDETDKQEEEETDEAETEEDRTGEEEIINNNDNNNNNETIIINNIDDEIRRKKDAYNAKRRDQRIKKKHIYIKIILLIL